MSAFEQFDPELVPLSVIRVDGGTQPRTAIDEGAVAEYAEAMRQGAQLPPVALFFDGAAFWLADGFHRYHAAQQAGTDEMLAQIRTGTRRDAVLYAVGANSAHGLRRTNADKRRAVQMLLEDTEWATWSDREIARICQVSASLVDSVRKSSLLENAVSEPAERTYTTRHGTKATMQTGRIGKTQPAAAPIPPNSRELENQVSPANLSAAEPAPAIATPRPAPEQGEVVVTDVEALRAENAQLRAELGELAEQFEETLAQAETMRKVLEADAPLAAAMQQLKQAQELARVLETRVLGLTNEKNEVLRRYNGARHELDKLRAAHG